MSNYTADVFCTVLYHTMAGVVREIEALSFVGANWPARKQLFISTVLNEEHQSSRYSSQQQHLATGKITSAIFPDGVTGVAADLIDATPETTLTWLQHVNMEGKVLQQLLELKPRIQASTGNGIFSGKDDEIQKSQTCCRTTPVTGGCDKHTGSIAWLSLVFLSINSSYILLAV